MVLKLNDVYPHEWLPLKQHIFNLQHWSLFYACLVHFILSYQIHWYFYLTSQKRSHNVAEGPSSLPLTTQNSIDTSDLNMSLDQNKSDGLTHYSNNFINKNSHDSNNSISCSSSFQGSFMNGFPRCSTPPSYTRLAGPCSCLLVINISSSLIKVWSKDIIDKNLLYVLWQYSDINLSNFLFGPRITTHASFNLDFLGVVEISALLNVLLSVSNHEKEPRKDEPKLTIIASKKTNANLTV